jgi:hypothetical protein
MQNVYELFLEKPYPSWIPDYNKQSWVSSVPEPDGGFWEWDESTLSWYEQMITPAPVDNPFGVVGYPRSGNHFLRYSIELLYALPKKFVEEHTAKALIDSDFSFVPVRNPLDCISSWSLFRVKPYQKIKALTQETMREDINYYLRFFTDCLALPTKVCFLDFNSFTTDVSYTINRTTPHIGDPVNKDVSLADVKNSIQETEQKPKLFLPEGTNKDIEIAKSMLQEDSKYKECVDLYQSVLAKCG